MRPEDFSAFFFQRHCLQHCSALFMVLFIVHKSLTVHMTTLFMVVALFGICSSLVMTVKLGANSSSIPAGNLGLKVSGAVSYDDIVKV
ncbi:hypothetical protein QYF36_016512 [Acer negundo]|nr:hypothetical protein QYF36_016512 [Acer negundo]